MYAPVEEKPYDLKVRYMGLLRAVSVSVYADRVMFSNYPLTSELNIAARGTRVIGRQYGPRQPFQLQQILRGSSLSFHSLHVENWQDTFGLLRHWCNMIISTITTVDVSWLLPFWSILLVPACKPHANRWLATDGAYCHGYLLASLIDLFLLCRSHESVMKQLLFRMETQHRKIRNEQSN